MTTTATAPRSKLPLAVGFLLFAATAAAWSLWPRSHVAPSTAAAAPVEPPADAGEPQAEAQASIDLLAWFGSFDGKTPVPDTFVYVPPAKTPGNERETPTRPVTGDRRPELVLPSSERVALPRGPTGSGVDSGPAPVAGGREPVGLRDTNGRALHQVSLVLITGAVSRAVVDGRVVGLGEALLAGRITRIAADGVHVDNGKEKLFFRLGDPANDGTGAAAAPPTGDK